MIAMHPFGTKSQFLPISDIFATPKLRSLDDVPPCEARQAPQSRRPQLSRRSKSCLTDCDPQSFMAIARGKGRRRKVFTSRAHENCALSERLRVRHGGRQPRSVRAKSRLFNRTGKTAEAVSTELRLRPKSKSSMTTTMPLQARSARPACDPPAPPGQLRAAPAICFLTCSEKIEFFGFVLPKPSACPLMKS